MTRWLCCEAIARRRGGGGQAQCCSTWGRGCGTIIRGIVTPHHLALRAWIRGGKPRDGRRPTPTTSQLKLCLAKRRLISPVGLVPYCVQLPPHAQPVVASMVLSERPNRIPHATPSHHPLLGRQLISIASRHPVGQLCATPLLAASWDRSDATVHALAHTAEIFFHFRDSSTCRYERGAIVRRRDRAAVDTWWGSDNFSLQLQSCRAM